MQVIWAGDTHGDTGHILWLIRKAVELGIDRIFVVGDFGAWEHTSTGVRFIDVINARAGNHGITIYWLRGNHDKVSHTRATYTEHDDEGFLKLRDRVRFAEDGHRWTWDGIRYMSFGGAYSVDKDWRLNEEQSASIKVRRANRERRARGLPEAGEDKSGTLWFPEEEATDLEVEEILKRDSSPVDVLLTHDKPRASNPGWNRKDFPECWPNQDRIDKLARAVSPFLIIHGHLHYYYIDAVRFLNRSGEATNTLVVGVNCNPGFANPKPMESFWACDPADYRDYLQVGGLQVAE